jgi:hypothetical protein
MGKADSRFATRNKRTICIPIHQEVYENSIESAADFRKCIDENIEFYAELFPPEISHGYLMKDKYHSKKLSIWIRRIEVGGIAYTIRPSFVMPYMTGFTKDVEKPLMLRKAAVPFWMLTYCFGRNPMYWYRMETSLGKNSLVGATIKDPERLPEHISADEKHSRIKGEKVYVPCTVGNDCILGVAVKESAGQDDLEAGYNVFKKEARDLNPNYSPKTANTDGWLPTIKALKALFQDIVLVSCFLHLYIAIRDRSRKKFKDIFRLVSEKLWDCYQAKSKASFAQRVRRLHEWACSLEMPSVIMTKIEKLRNNLSSFSIAYEYPGAHRTSNMVDRLMQRLNRYLFCTQYFHGSIEAAEQGIRAWALIQNFAPSNPRTVAKYHGLQSPAERLNGFRYHDNWLQNLLVSASLCGFRGPPQNP